MFPLLPHLLVVSLKGWEESEMRELLKASPSPVLVKRIKQLIQNSLQIIFSYILWKKEKYNVA